MMTSEELYPEIKEEDIRKIKEEEALIEKFNKLKLEKANSIYTCGKCKQNKVEYKQVQTRSADEGMSVFCTCLNCGNKWRMS